MHFLFLWLPLVGCGELFEKKIPLFTAKSSDEFWKKSTGVGNANWKSFKLDVKQRLFWEIISWQIGAIFRQMIFLWKIIGCMVRLLWSKFHYLAACVWWFSWCIYISDWSCSQVVWICLITVVSINTLAHTHPRASCVCLIQLTRAGQQLMNTEYIYFIHENSDLALMIELGKRVRKE